ncbi:group XIIA secretory phospholipase A2-like [Asterias amurensis]|uniref:group XIIA secretory phospholipase A2-like n=1 Tax=Asterias amurensis TaxID=7602 RepID=UPI003AB1A8D3
MILQNTFLEVLAIVCLHLSFTKQLKAASNNHAANDKRFGEYMNDFATIADNIALGLKTASKAAKIVSGQNDIGGEVDECIFTCKNGGTAMKRPGYSPEVNGCGAYGIQFDLSSLPGVEKCCNKHDRCYGQCGMPKLTCEDQFAKCLDGVCDVMKGVMNFNSEELEGCQMTVQMMVMAVLELGCQTYIDTQKEACICQIDNRTDRMKSKREL